MWPCRHAYAQKQYSNRLWQSRNHSPHHYTTSTSLHCQHQLMLLVPIPDPTICVSQPKERFRPGYVYPVNILIILRCFSFCSPLHTQCILVIFQLISHQQGILPTETGVSLCVYDNSRRLAVIKKNSTRPVWHHQSGHSNNTRDHTAGMYLPDCMHCTAAS